MRRALLSVTVLLLSAGLPAASAHDTSPALAAVTSVVTSQSATAQVRLPHDARVALADGVSFRGPGRLLALRLEGADHSSSLHSYRLPDFAGGRQVTYGSVPPATCTSQPSDQVPLTSDCTGSAPPTHVLLAAGSYRLTVVADGSPVRVTLRMQGLRGNRTLRPSTLLPTVQQTLPAREQVGSSLVTFGDSADLGRPVETFLVARTRSGSTPTGSSACRREDAGTAPMSFGPHCPGGSSGTFSYEAGAFGGGTGFASSTGDTSGPVGLGGSFSGSSGAELGQALGVWLARP